ncbi:hypothetical protein DFR48_101308, partial [Ciceribacter lividus]
MTFFLGPLSTRGILAFVRQRLGAVATAIAAFLFLVVGTSSPALAATCTQQTGYSPNVSSGSTQVAYAILSAGSTVTITSPSGYVNYTAQPVGSAYSYVFAASPAQVTVATAGTYDLLAYAVTSSNNLTWSGTVQVDCPLPAPVAGAVTATVAANSSANPITLDISGGSAASVA